MSLCNHCNNLCDNDISYVSCKRCKLNYHYNCLSKANILPSTFSKNTILIIYSRFLHQLIFLFFVHNVYHMY